MSTQLFLDTILPSSGKRVIVAIGPKGPRQFFSDKNSVAAAAIAKHDNAGVNVYHACATYLDTKSRKAENVHSVKSFWLDIDCGAGKPYATQDDAWSALVDFWQLLDLWTPYVISSGNGLHVYWVLEQDIVPDQWHPTAQLLKRICTHAGFHAGPERTADIASILRPVGATHRKAEPKLVEVYNEGVAGPYEFLHAQLEAYATAHGIEAEFDLGAPPAGVVSQDMNSDLMGGRDYGPPPAIDAIVEGCAVIREFRDSGGNIEEPLWRACMGVVKLCEDGEQLCHDWSAGHKQYTYAETQSKMTSIKGGATTCATLGSFRPDACAACPFNKQIKSPISIAYKPVEATQVVQAPTQLLPTAPLVTFQVPPMPDGFKYMVAGNKTGIYAQVKDPADSSGKTLVDKRVTTMLFYPISRIRGADDKYSMILRAHINASETRDIEVPTSYIADGNKLFPLLASVEIAAEQGMNPHMQNYIRRWMDYQRQHVVATRSYDQLGWHGKDFLIGDTLFCNDGTEKKVTLSPAAQKIGTDFIPKGDVQSWVNIVDRAYNHPGVEDLQFAMLAGMAAPLVHMFTDYGGMLVYLHTEEGGKGKTTIERAALSTWGSWRELQITEGQATANAIYATLGTVSNMPIVIDEMTNMQNDEVGQMVHLISAGNPKKRCDIKGGLVQRDARWETIVLGSGNMLLGEKLAQHRATSQAERVRIFEYTIDIGRSPIDRAEAVQLFPQFNEHYGHAGRELMRYITANFDDVKARLFDVQRDISKQFGLQQSERYWEVLLSCVLTMHEIASQLGLIYFPREPLDRWINMTLQANRGATARTVSKPTDLFGQMLADLWPGMLVTQGLGDLYKGWDAWVEQHPKGAVVGRVITARPGQAGQSDKPVVWIAASAAAAWCNRKGVTASEVFKAGVAAGLLNPTETRVRLGSGSKQYAGMSQQIACWETTYAASGAMPSAVPAPPSKLSVVQRTPGSP